MSLAISGAISEKLETIGRDATSQIEAASTLDDLEKIRVMILGKKGSIGEALRGMGQLPPEERPKVGEVANQWKRKIEALLEDRKTVLGSAEIQKRMESERIDPTAPARVRHRGSLHPVTQVTRKITQIFQRLGFDVATGPEIDTEFLTFDALNIPADHPARDMQDTFFVGPGVVLRTHTSPVQMRTMLARKPPVRIICPGTVYRRDNDATHSPMFHQVEGLWVDEEVTMADLRGTLEFFARELFGPSSQIRLRPSYFPFVEPGAEIDVSCFLCEGNKGKACTVCRGSGWLEILGAGLVHPHLFEVAGYKKMRGFAFGMGVERIAMLLHGIPDLRLMYEGDLRFLTQF